MLSGSFPAPEKFTLRADILINSEVNKVASSVAGLFMLRVANYDLLLCTYDNLIVMVFSSTPCNSSNSISGDQQILYLSRPGFSPIGKEECVQTIRFMLHVFASHS
jgi:hypothetical protein